MKLEELARQSSVAARVSVAHLDPPPLGGDAPHRSRVPLLLGAAALVLLVGFGVFWATRDDVEKVTASSTELPVLGLADPASFGLQLAGMFDPESMADQINDEGSATFVYFGTSGADDPYADGDLLVGEFVTDDLASLSDGEPVTVRGGLDAVVADRASTAMFSEVTVVEWFEPATTGSPVQMILASSSLTAEELVAVADAFDLTAGVEQLSFTSDAELPAALEALEIVAVEDGIPQAMAVSRVGTNSGPIVGYERAESISSTMVESVAVASNAGTVTESIIADRWWASTVDAVEVGGKPAWLLTYDFGGEGQTDGEPIVRAHSVRWQWAPGVIATLTATTSGDSEFAVDVAGAVVELDPSVLDLAEEENLEGLADDDFDEVWGSGSGETDVEETTVSWAWALGLQDDQFCTSLFAGSGGSSSCEPLAQLLERVPQAPVVVAQQQMDALQFGVIIARPDDEVVLAEGTLGELVEVLLPNDADGTRLLVWVGPVSAPARFDVVVDGEIVETLDLADGTAAVEEGEPAPPVGSEEEPPGVEIDVASNPSAQGLGIADDFVTEATGGNDRITWAVGVHDGDSYIVADGEATFAALLPDDITVLKPTELPDGTVWTYVIARDVPSCLTLIGVSEVTTSQPDETTGGPELIVWPLEGTADGWRLVFDRSGQELWIDLPDIEGSVPWLNDACGDPAATDDAEALSLADLDVHTLASMASDGLLVDRVTLPPGFEYVESGGTESSWSHLFSSVFPTDISIGWRLGDEPSSEPIPDSIRSQQLTLQTPTGDRSVSTWEYGPPGRGEIRITYPVNGRRIEVTGSDVNLDVLLDIMTDLVVLPPVENSGATATIADARAALDGLPFTDALRVATEAGWQIRVVELNGEGQEVEDDRRPNRVNVSYTDGGEITVDSIG